jgi:hypothetical protein
VAWNGARIGGAIELDAERLVGIEAAGLHDQGSCEGLIEPPVAQLVGVGQRRATHATADTHVIELGALRVEAGDGVAQAVAVGELGERHAAELVLTAEAFDRAIAAEPLDAPAQRVQRQMLHQLGENDLALIHRSSPSAAAQRSRTFAARRCHVQVDDSRKNRITARKSIASAIAPITDSGHYWVRPPYPHFPSSLSILANM